MKKVVLSVVAAIALSTPAFAADMPVKAMKASVGRAAEPVGYRLRQRADDGLHFRGITQSAHQPSVAAYFEPRYNINKDVQLYVGVAGESISFPNRAAAEIDIYGGIRPTFGKLALDFGVWYYYYPGGLCFGHGAFQVNARPPATCRSTATWPRSDASFFEVYGKATYTFGDFAFGPTFYYSPNFLNSGAAGDYFSGNREIHRASHHGSVRWCGWLLRLRRIRTSGPRHQRRLLRRRRRRSPAVCRHSTRTTTPGTSASASPTRCSRSICATGTNLNKAIARPSPATPQAPGWQRHRRSIRDGSARTGAARTSSPSCQADTDARRLIK